MVVLPRWGELAVGLGVGSLPSRGRLTDSKIDHTLSLSNADGDDYRHILLVGWSLKTENFWIFRCASTS